jgi:predicted hotdog family 3-hydroxylacyl-ACP dehydratase
MPLDRRWIESRIPHRGSMCLLDEVLEWDAEHILCRSGTHRAADNPLRAGKHIGIACGIEYAAQAMAVHGALSQEAAATGLATLTPAAGFLAGVRNVQFYIDHLDEIQDDLICHAVRLAGDSGSALYEFELRGANRTLLRGRATVVLDAGEQLKAP